MKIMNAIKQFQSYMKNINTTTEKCWNDLEYRVDTVYGKLRISIFSSNFTSVGKPRSKYNNLVSIYTSFEEIWRAIPYLKLNNGNIYSGKLNYHLSGGNSSEENWTAIFERFKDDLEKIMVVNA